MTFHKTSTITVLLHAPLIMGGAYIRSIDDEINSYSHVIGADGGFLSASISMNSNAPSVDDWIANGIGRHIVACGPGGEVVWEGFVDNISIGMGNITIERGRLTEVCNRCSVLYTPILEYDSSGNPVTGTEISSLILDDEDSIRKYGIWEQVISGGQLIDERDPVTGFTPAENLRNAYLEDNREPSISHNPVLVSESGGDITISLDCKGYIEWIGNYVYNNTTETPFSTDVTTKILTVLAEDPNDILSTNLNNIKYNGVLIGMPEDQNRSAMEIINEAVKMGGANYERWTFGIYEDRTPRFEQFSTTVDYHYYITGNQRILSLNDSEISPWNIRPGKIVFIMDTYLGGIDTIEPKVDPRVMYLEQVTFTAPQTISLEGKRINKFDNMMAQYGLTGGV